MQAEIYWIDVPGICLSIMARPRAGEWLVDEVESWRRSGITTVLSLLEKDEVRELGLAKEPALCTQMGIEFLSFPIKDRAVPTSLVMTRRLVVEISERLAQGGSVAIHCRSGIGRSALIAACVLSTHGIGNAFELISKARKCPVPDTDEQRAWIKAFHEISF